VARLESSGVYVERLKRPLVNCLNGEWLPWPWRAGQQRVLVRWLVLVTAKASLQSDEGVDGWRGWAIGGHVEYLEKGQLMALLKNVVKCFLNPHCLFASEAMGSNTIGAAGAYGALAALKTGNL